MSEQNSTGWPFGQAAGEGLDISAIFGTGTADPDRNPFDPTGAASAPAASVTPPPAAPVTPSPAAPVTPPPAAPVTPPPAAPVMPPPAAPVTQPPAAPVTQPPAAPVAQSPAVPVAQSPAAPVTQSPAAPIAPPPAAPVTQSPVEAEQPANPIEAAFAKQEMANAQQNLLEKKPIFCHKGAKEPIEDPTITFEELRICKAEDFVDLEEGKTVSWSMEYGGIRKEVKDPKGTTIAAMKQSIERSREFLEALKKSKDKNPDCLVRPKVIMKTTAGWTEAEFDAQIENTRSQITELREKISDAIIYISKRTELTFAPLKLNRVAISLYDIVKSTGERKDAFRFTYQAEGCTKGRLYKCLSHSERLRAGMEVSEMVKRLTGRNYPVFADDMESIEDLSNVKPTGQVIMARVVPHAPLSVQPLQPIQASAQAQAA